jgi:hypothetical protein
VMEINRLRDALAQDDPDTDTVLRLLHTKRRARDRRRLVFGAALGAVVVALPAAWLVTRGDPAAPPVAAGSSGPSTAGSPGGSAGPIAGAGACTAPRLDEWLRGLVAAGASVVTARGVLTGRTARDGVRHHEMTMDRVRTVAGPAVPDGTVVWVETPELPPLPDQVARGNPGPLWGPDGALFGVVRPQALTRSPLGVTIIQAPVVDGQVVFGISGGCWNWQGLGGTPYRGPLTEIPGSGTYERAAVAGFTAVALPGVERLARRE